MPLNGSDWTPWEIFNATTNQTMLELAEYNNSITQNMFWILTLMSLFFIFLMITSYYRSKVSLQVSLGMTTTLAFLMWGIELVGIHVPIIFMLAFAGSMAFLWGDKT